MERKWTVKRDCRGMTTNEIINAILEDRGVEDPYALLNPTEDDMIPFEEMKNIKTAAQIIMNGIENNSRFMVYYDTDTDGVSSGTIATRWLKQHGVDVVTYINKGKEHGIAKTKSEIFEDVDILWIVDSIEVNMYPYENALKAGVDKIVITDHHIVSRRMQRDMERNGNIFLVSSAVDYKNPAASGSIVTWKLCAYMDWLELDDYSDDLVDLSAMGAIADMVDIGLSSPENRYICHQGFNNQRNPAIKKINGTYDFNSQAVSFGLAPLINASNRMNENEKAMHLFLSDDKKEINALVADLKECKESQNDEIACIMPLLEEQAEEQMDRKVMFFFTDEADGKKGLIANKLLSVYQRPIIVLGNRINIDEDTGEIIKHEYFGSFRAVGVDNFKEYVDNTGLAEAGGHENAAGIWMDADNLDAFKEALEEALKDIEFVQETCVDIQVSADQITDDLIKKIKMLDRISGTGWQKIQVMVSDVQDYLVGNMSSGKHLKLTVGDSNLLFIKWNYTDDWDIFDKPISVIGNLDSGFFGRAYYRQLIVSDFKVG